MDRGEFEMGFFKICADDFTPRALKFLLYRGICRRLLGEGNFLYVEHSYWLLFISTLEL